MTIDSVTLLHRIYNVRGLCGMLVCWLQRRRVAILLRVGVQLDSARLDRRRAPVRLLVDARV